MVGNWAANRGRFVMVDNHRLVLVVEGIVTMTMAAVVVVMVVVAVVSVVSGRRCATAGEASQAAL